MTIEELRGDLGQRIGKRVEVLFTRDGEPALEMTDLYQASPAGFGGQLQLRDGSRLVWELWLEDGERWNFHASPIPV
ncbi:MAG: hypothetical protein ISQ53_01715 [Synechococcus sp. BS307-5m-G39]|nr:hypothetical protein [Synechococcus sp. BS307-5m-G39]MBL6800372.1 hypothetical protein [Synechococcus sp. BS307-5m-G37]